MGKIISIWNNKGGVGKTTSVLTIGQILAKNGNKVLLIDMDAQGNLSSKFESEDNKNSLTVYEFLMEDIEFTDVVNKYENEGIKIDYITSDLRLQYAITEIILQSHLKNPNSRLQKKLEDIKDLYDYIILDNSPSMDVLVTNALVSSSEVIVPINSDKYSAKGIEMITSRIEEIKNEFNPKLKISGIFLNAYSNTKINNSALEFYNEIPGFMSTKIHRATEIQENTVKPELLINSKLRNKNIIEQFENLVEELGL